MDITSRANKTKLKNIQSPTTWTEDKIRSMGWKAKITCTQTRIEVRGQRSEVRGKGYFFYLFFYSYIGKNSPPKPSFIFLNFFSKLISALRNSFEL